MLPTPREYCSLFECILENDILGSPKNANMYKTYGYFADKPLFPLYISRRPLNYFGKTLKVNIKLSKKGHMTKWKVNNPTIRDIIKALKNIEHGINHSYVSLSNSDKDYIRTNVHSLEYQNDTTNKHYYCSPEYLSSMTVSKAFISFAQGSLWWKKRILWSEGYSF